MLQTWGSYLKMMMIVSKDSTIQTLRQVLTVNITQYRHYSRYNEYDDEIRWRSQTRHWCCRGCPHRGAQSPPHPSPPPPHWRTCRLGTGPPAPPWEGCRPCTSASTGWRGRGPGHPPVHICAMSRDVNTPWIWTFKTNIFSSTNYCQLTVHANLTKLTCSMYWYKISISNKL